MNITKLLTLLTVIGLLVPSLFSESSEPSLLEYTPPAYPKEARADGVEGIVLVEALINENGKVFAADVISSPDERLNVTALEAITQWKFTPAKVDGKAIMKVVRIPVNFYLTDPVEDSISRSKIRAIAAR